MIEFSAVRCPYCGETFETAIDASGGNQEYVEDCQVCCRPIVFRITVGLDAALLDLELRREQD
ncbi:MAG TPA: CPXCG motif-containing cysteine-rich protein [Burkholderiales bacterium]